MSFHPAMPYGTEQWHRSQRATLPEGPEFQYSAEHRARFEEFLAGKRELQALFTPTPRTSLAGYSATKSALLLSVLDMFDIELEKQGDSTGRLAKLA